MPFYEYKCPNGHLFEVFHSMSDEGPQACEICGASPVVIVLHPVAVHFKGSGFYSTDYGKGAKKKEGGATTSTDGGSGGSDSGSSSSSDSGGDSGGSSSTPKAAEA